MFTDHIDLMQIERKLRVPVTKQVSSSIELKQKQYTNIDWCRGQH